MLLLTATTDKLQVVTDATADVDVHASYVDTASGTQTPGRQNTGTINTAATTDIVAAPAASTIRNIKTLWIRNTHASVTVSVLVQFNQSATIIELHKATLPPNTCLQYIEGVGFFLLDASSSSALMSSAESSNGQNVLLSELERAAIGTFVMISGTAYYVYVGRTVKAITAAFIEWHVTGAGAGAQTAEAGLFSTPAPPSKSAQTLTKIIASGTLDSQTSTGVKRNTSTFAQAIPPGTHLWAALRTAMATTQPTVGGLAGDMSQGHVLTTTGGGALTGVTTASGTIPTIGTATVAPDLRVTLN